MAGRPSRLLVVIGSVAGVVLLIAVWRMVGQMPRTAVSPGQSPSPITFVVEQQAAPSIKDDPAIDGWDSELFNQQADKQWKQLAHWIIDSTKVDKAHVAKLASADFSSTAMRPAELKRVFDGSPFQIDRASDTSNTTIYQGLDGFVQMVRVLADPFVGASKTRVKIKIISVQLNEQEVTTRQHVSITGITGQGRVEENATWVSVWSRETKPRLIKLSVEDYERAQLTLGKTLFVDCTEAVLQRNMATDDLLGYSLPHWYVRIQSIFGQSTLGYHGLSVGDANGDGLDDVYMAHAGGMPNQLFLQNKDGTVKNVAPQAGVNWMEQTAASLFIDLDNDGDQDMVIGSTPQVIVMSNNGQAQFTGRKVLPAPAMSAAMSLAAADYDQDGDLDLYICYYSTGTPMPYHDANNGVSNLLWRNDGNWQFTEVTRQVGLDVNNTRFSLAACWEDYDNDGDLDLYVANDFGRNNLYRNDGGRFHDVAGEVGVEDISAGMSAAFGDYNHDGRMDLYVSNMFSSAGNRITYQRKFNPNVQGRDRKLFQRHARGNSLFKSLPDDTFEDVSVAAGVTMGRWAWCSRFIDINNDSFEDLLIVNGNMTNDNPKDL
jgi:hypothetical protein